MHRQQHIETLKGEGRVFHKGQVVIEPARHRIEISRKVHVIRTMTDESEVPGLGRIEGVLLTPVPWSLVGEAIELELKDGRRWKCLIQSSNGRMVNSGGIEEPAK